MTFEEIREKYRSGLSERIAELERFKNQPGFPDASALAAVRKIAHQFKGSGTTYGFPELTEAGAAVEAASPAALTAALDRLLSALKSAAG